MMYIVNLLSTYFCYSYNGCASWYNASISGSVQIAYFCRVYNLGFANYGYTSNIGSMSFSVILIILALLLILMVMPLVFVVCCHFL